MAGSLSNVTVIVGAAWAGQASDVGTVGVLTSLYVVVLCAARGMLGEWLLLTRSTRPAPAEEAVGASVVIGVMAGAGTLPIMLLLLPEQGMAAIILAAAFPVLLLQDTLRYVAISRGAARHAAASDILWLACTVLATVGCLATNKEAAAWLVGAWTGGATIGAGYLLLVSRLRPSVRSTRAFMAAEGRLRASLAADALLTTGTLSVSVIVSAGTVGVSGVGVIRLLQALYGPITLLVGVLYVEFAVRRLQDLHGVTPRQAAAWMTLVLTSSIVVLTLCLLAAEELVGADAEVIEAVAAVLVVFAISQVTAGVASAAVTGLKLADRAATAAKVRAFWAIGLVGGTALGGAFAGVLGYIWLTTVVNLVAATVWWHYLSVSHRANSTKGV